MDNDKKYCYAIFAYDQKPNYSKISAQIARPEVGKKSTAVEKETVNTNSLNCSLYAKLITLGALSGDESSKAAFCEASTVAGNSQQVELSDQSKKIYEKVSSRANNLSGLNVLNKYSLAYFIQSGTPTTKQLGSGERAGSVMSYYQAFNKLPETENDWSDVIKIANGRWPKEISRQAEDKAKIEFKKIYKREAEMKNPNDNAAVSVIAYGLRPAKRNQNSEKNAINSFKSIYKKTPQSALDWDIVRSIAYSGARR